MSYLVDSMTSDTPDEDSECVVDENSVWIVAIACFVGAWTAVAVAILYLLSSQPRPKAVQSTKTVLCRLQTGPGGDEVIQTWEVDQLPSTMPMSTQSDSIYATSNSNIFATQR